VVALTDSTGAVVDRYAYDPYGESLPEGTNETVPQQLRYASYWFDAALGWYWVGVRSYDPEGRWIQPDPSQADGLRTYVYADDDPVDETDALGLGGICDVPLFGGAACAVGALAHGAYDLIAGDDIKTLQDKHKSGVESWTWAATCRSSARAERRCYGTTKAARGSIPRPRSLARSRTLAFARRLAFRSACFGRAGRPLVTVSRLAYAHRDPRSAFFRASRHSIRTPVSVTPSYSM